MPSPWEKYSKNRIIDREFNIWLRSGPWARYIKKLPDVPVMPEAPAGGGLVDAGRDVEPGPQAKDDGTGDTGVGNIMGTGALDIGGISVNAETLTNAAVSLTPLGVPNAISGLMGGPTAGSMVAGLNSEPTGVAANPMQLDPAQMAARNADVVAADTGQSGTSGFGGGNDAPGANADGYGGGDAGFGDGSPFAKGGLVKRGMLGGPNPKGKDDGYAPLDEGEYVVKASATKKAGSKNLQALNEGRAKIVKRKKK